MKRKRIVIAVLILVLLICAYYFVRTSRFVRDLCVKADFKRLSGAKELGGIKTETLYESSNWTGDGEWLYKLVFEKDNSSAFSDWEELPAKGECAAFLETISPFFSHDGFPDLRSFTSGRCGLIYKGDSYLESKTKFFVYDAEENVVYYLIITP